MKHPELRALLAWYFEKRSICGLHSIPIDKDIELSREGKSGVSTRVFEKVCLITATIAPLIESGELTKKEWQHLQQEFVGRRKTRRLVLMNRHGGEQWKRYRRKHLRILCGCCRVGRNRHWGALCKLETALLEAGLLKLMKPKPGIPPKDPRAEMVAALKHLQYELGE